MNFTILSIQCVGNYQLIDMEHNMSSAYEVIKIKINITGRSGYDGNSKNLIDIFVF